MLGRPNMRKPILVGITGGSGSGKSYLAQKIVSHFGSKIATLVQQDWYYRDLSAIPHEIAAKTDFDDPASLELDLLFTHLQTLANGSPIDAPQYAFSRFSRQAETLAVAPRPLVVIEGLFVLQHPDISKLLDISVFVDTPADLRLLRRIRRDLTERGYELERILDFWERIQMPSFEKFVLPQRSHAAQIWNSPQDTAFVPAFLADLENQIARNAAQPTP